MRGFGSGWNGNVKNTVEACLILSSARLMEERWLGPNLFISQTLTWHIVRTKEKLSSIGYDAHTGDDAGSLRLHYSRISTGELTDYQVQATTTPLPWGGRRWWFQCPLSDGGHSCGRRVGKLYLPPGGKYFGCRHCYNLTYKSCQESHRLDSLYAEVAREVGVSTRLVKKYWRQDFHPRNGN